jgi:hypothetical protein
VEGRDHGPPDSDNTPLMDASLKLSDWGMPAPFYSLFYNW